VSSVLRDKNSSLFWFNASLADKKRRKAAQSKRFALFANNLTIAVQSSGRFCVSVLNDNKKCTSEFLPLTQIRT